MILQQRFHFNIQSVASFLLVALTLWSQGVIAAPLSIPSGGSISGETKSADKALIEKWKSFDGKTVSQLHFEGRRRTRESALRWITTTTEGRPFSSTQLAIDVQTIYNTGNLYNISTQVEQDPNDPTKIDVTITMRDKWTLLPFGGAQAGGGSLTLGGGFEDTNLLGYNIASWVAFYNYNGTFGYEVNANQEYIAGTQIMGSVDWSNNIFPTILHNIDDTSAGNFSWQRQQEEVMVGTHLPGPIRLMLYADYFFDSLRTQTGNFNYVYPGNQYRIHPQVIFGRANIENYLERGQELTIGPSATNPFGTLPPYQGLVISYKNISILPNEGNIGGYLAAGTLNGAAPAYEYGVGGYGNLRGYADNREIGPYFARGTLEYRPMLAVHHFDWDLVDLVAIQGCVFTDAGSAWGDSTLTNDPRTQQLNMLWSAGLGLRINFVHYASAIIRIDAARTIAPDEGYGISFGAGQFF